MLNKLKAMDHVETTKLAIERIEACIDAYERNQNPAAIKDCYDYIKIRPSRNSISY